MAAARAETAAALIAQRGLDAQVFVTERAGHARELAAAAVNNGVTTVLAWGGDGTVNEVASALVFRDARLGVVPGGSGNGLARELGIPLDPIRALGAALDGRERQIDVGEFGGRIFVNVAGVGLDARVAYGFGAADGGRRGLRRYLTVAAREIFASKPEAYTLVTDGAVAPVRALLIAIANGRQYGNGAIIAPTARLDDGRLDVVVAGMTSAVAAALQVPRLFTGSIASAPGVSIVKATEIEIRAAAPFPCHVDGEPFMGGPTVVARCRPGALRVIVPAGVSMRQGA